jgi:hypothetical protein
MRVYHAKLPKGQAVLFPHQHGKTIENHPRDFSFSLDGVRFYRVKECGSRSSSRRDETGKYHLEFSLTFKVPQISFEGEMTYNSDTDLLTVNEVPFPIVSATPAITGDRFTNHFQSNIVPLPNDRREEYFFREKNGGRLHIYVDAEVYATDYSSHRLFLSSTHFDIPHWREIEINQLKRMKDGGTTVIETNIGHLFVPTPFNIDGQPKWTSLRGGHEPEDHYLERVE